MKGISAPIDFDSMPQGNALSRIDVEYGQVTLSFSSGDLRIGFEGSDRDTEFVTEDVLFDEEVDRLIEVLTVYRAWKREREGKYDHDWCFEPHHQDFVNELLSRAPESWDGEEAADDIAIRYVRALEERLVQKGGSLEQYPNGD